MSNHTCDDCRIASWALRKSTLLSWCDWVRCGLHRAFVHFSSRSAKSRTTAGLNADTHRDVERPIGDSVANNVAVLEIDDQKTGGVATISPRRAAILEALAIDRSTVMFPTVWHTSGSTLFEEMARFNESRSNVGEPAHVLKPRRSAFWSSSRKDQSPTHKLTVPLRHTFSREGDIVRCSASPQARHLGHA